MLHTLLLPPASVYPWLRTKLQTCNDWPSPYVSPFLLKFKRIKDCTSLSSPCQKKFCFTCMLSFVFFNVQISGKKIFLSELRILSLFSQKVVVRVITMLQLATWSIIRTLFSAFVSTLWQFHAEFMGKLKDFSIQMILVSACVCFSQ